MDRILRAVVDADTSPLRRGLEQADQIADQFAGRFQGRFSNLRIDPPQIAAPLMPDMSAMKGPDAGGLTTDLAAGMRQAMAPIQGIITDLGAKFSQVGKTMISYLHRIDANMKFPTMDKTLSNLRALAKSTFKDMEGRVKLFGNALELTLGGAQALNRFRMFMVNVGKVASTGFQKAADSSNVFVKTTQTAISTAKGLGTQIALSLGAFGLAYKGADAIKTGISGASDLNETLSKTEAIFGGSSKAIIDESNRMADAFGASKQEYMTAAGNFGAVFKGLGKPQAEAAALGNSLAKLAMDMASFDNTSNAEAFQAISSALRGEMDPIEKYRVFLNADKVALEALTLGLAKNKNEISDAAKKMAIMSLITKDTADAQGDLLRTSGGTSNQMKKLGGVLSNLGTDIGTALLPAVNVAVRGFAGAAASLSAAFTGSKDRFAGMVEALAAGFTRVGQLATYLLPSFMAIGKTLVGAFSGGSGAIMDMVPTWDSFAVAAKGALEGVNSALQTAIGWIKQVPTWIDQTFDEGTTGKIVETGVAIGGTAVALSTLGTVFGGVVAGASALLAPLISIPVLAAGAGLGLAYLTGSYNGLSDAANAVDFAVKNNTDMFAYWYHSVMDWVDHLADNFLRFQQAVGNFALGKGWSFEAIELKPSRETEAAIEAMRKNTFEPKKVAPPPVAPVLDTKAIQDQVTALTKRAAEPAKVYDPAKAKEAEKVDKRLESFAKEFIGATQTPMEKFQEAMRWATEAFQAGKLTKDQFSRAEQFANKEAGFSDTIKFAAAMDSNGKDAYSSILRQGSATGERQYKPKDLTKPTQETAKNTADALPVLQDIRDSIVNTVKPIIYKFI